MFLSPAGDIIFYRRRADGQDTLYAFQPDAPGVPVHAHIAASKGQLRAWPAAGQVVVCPEWPRAQGGLRLRFHDAGKLAGVLQADPDKLHELLARAPELRDFSREPRALPPELYERLGGATVAVPGIAPSGKSPAVYVADGAAASYHLIELDFLEPGTLPGNLYVAPSGGQVWLTVGDSNHLFVLDGQRFELAGDIVWPVEQKALARVAFHPARDEAWISAHSCVFVYRASSLERIAEIAIESEPRWHRGERILGMIGGVTFSRDGERALAARPMSGDLLEIDVASRQATGRIPVALDPLDILYAPTTGNVYLQSLRNGNLTWLPYR
jgi:hypothetical protein